MLNYYDSTLSSMIGSSYSEGLMGGGVNHSNKCRAFGMVPGTVSRPPLLPHQSEIQSFRTLFCAACHPCGRRLMALYNLDETVQEFWNFLSIGDSST